MRAVVFQNGKLSVQEIDEPTPGSGEVLVEVLRAGICGSDKAAVYRAEHMARLTELVMGQAPGDPSQPMVLGHEWVAKVVSYGPDTKGILEPGTRVVGVPALRHRGDPIPTGFAGPDTPGSYAQRILMDEELLIPVPEAVTDDVAALTEPLTVALRAVERLDPKPDEVAMVLGCGPIGLVTIAMLVARGVSPIVASDCSAERLKLATAVGADHVVNTSKNKPYEVLQKVAATDDKSKMAPPTFGFGPMPLRPVIAFECSGWPGSIEELFEGLPPSSRICQVGINEQGDHLEMAIGIVKELQVVFTNYYTPLEFERAMAMIGDGSVKIAPIVTKVIGLDEVADMFEELEHNPRDGKVLIDPSR